MYENIKRRQVGFYGTDSGSRNISQSPRLLVESGYSIVDISNSVHHGVYDLDFEGNGKVFAIGKINGSTGVRTLVGILLDVEEDGSIILENRSLSKIENPCGFLGDWDRKHPGHDLYE